jgi:hypothetical protein
MAVNRPVLRLLLCAGVLLGGCQTVPPSPDRHMHGHSPPPATDTTYWPETHYLGYMHTLTVALPETQKALYQQAEREYREQGTAHAKLRFALTLGLLEDPNGNLAKAQQLYTELLKSGEPMPPQIQSLVQVQLGEARRQRILQEQIALLQEALDKAEAKIKAMSTIEKNLEQPVPESKQKAAP